MKSLPKLPPFALLAFGRLGKSAILSIQSIDSLEPRKIYILADNAGEAWLEEEVIDTVKSNIVILKLDDYKFQEIGLVNAADLGYSEYGRERFNKLTTLKWYLISTLFSEFNEEACFFSDLDVVWLKKPVFSDFETSDDAFIYAQDDSNKEQNKIHFCTGLMYWKRTTTSLEVLQLLYQTQKKMLISGNMINDEQVFNLLRPSRPEIRSGIRALKVQDFVIGHRFFSLLFRFNFKVPVAFHANYVKGEKPKLRRLTVILHRSNRSMFWLPYFLFELGIESIRRLMRVYSLINSRKL